jgi:hypothetical protein
MYFKEDSINSVYIDDIDVYMRSIENKYIISCNLLDSNLEKNNNRQILVDWLIRVNDNFKLLHDTLHLTVYLIDAYLGCIDVSVSRLQLLGIGALLLASKYEDVHPPCILDLTELTCNAYTNKEVIEIEFDIYKTVNYNLGRPSPLYFLSRYIDKLSCITNEQYMLAKFFIDMSLEYSIFSCILPSKIAASSLYLAMQILLDDYSVKYVESVCDYEPKKIDYQISLLVIYTLRYIHIDNEFRNLIDKYKNTFVISELKVKLENIKEKSMRHTF